jgi:hypothetical protein
MERVTKKLKYERQIQLYRDPTCYIQFLPDDLIRFITSNHLFFWNDILALSRTCKRFYRALQDSPYRLFYDKESKNDYYHIWETPSFFGWSNSLTSTRIKLKDTRCIVNSHGDTIPHYIWKFPHMNYVLKTLRTDAHFDIQISPDPPPIELQDLTLLDEFNSENVPTTAVRPTPPTTVSSTFSDNTQRPVYIRELLKMLTKLNQMWVFI